MGSSCPQTTSGHDLGRTTQFRNFRTPSIFLEWIMLHSSIWYIDRLWAVLAQTTNWPLRWRGLGCMTKYPFFEFGTQIQPRPLFPMNHKMAPYWVWSGSNWPTSKLWDPLKSTVDTFFKFGKMYTVNRGILWQPLHSLHSLFVE